MVYYKEMFLSQSSSPEGVDVPKHSLQEGAPFATGPVAGVVGAPFNMPRFLSKSVICALTVAVAHVPSGAVSDGFWGPADGTAVSPYAATQGPLLPGATGLPQTARSEGASEVASGSPAKEVVFNNPYGSEDEKRAVVDRIIEGIDNAPAGSTVRLAAFSFTLPDFADRVIAANKRGVNVRIVTDNHLYDGSSAEEVKTAQLERLKAELGEEVTTGPRSFIKICDKACLGEGIMHVKLFTYSETGDSKNVTMVSSSNLTPTQVNAWNNLVIYNGNKELYDSMVKYFDSMATEPDEGNWYTEANSGDSTILTYPRTDYSSTKQDPYYHELSKVKCEGKAVPAKVELAMFQWTKSRLVIAKKLSELASSGCDVSVVISGANTSPEIVDELTSQPEIKVVDADANFKDGKPGTFNHNKYLLIDPRNGEELTVSTGAQNLSISAIKENEELVLQIKGDEDVYRGFAQNFDHIRAGGRIVLPT